MIIRDIIAVLMSILAPMAVNALTPDAGLKIMTYNVRHLEGIDRVIDPSRTAAIINSQRPDVVMLQEVDSVTQRSSGIDQMAALAKLTGMVPTFAKAIDFEGGGYGIGLLSRTAPLCVRRIPLPGEEPRMLLVAEFDKYVVACTHLALEEDARMQSVPIILAQLDSFRSKPFIIGGDWNSAPASQLLQALRANFNIVTPQMPTFPADSPAECLDYIAVGSRFVPAGCNTAILEGEASDHRAVITTIFF